MDCGKPCACPTYRDHLLSVGIAASATPSRRPATAATEVQERQLDRDLDAYRRLRKDGLQPKGIDGSARLEARADHKLEVEAGRLLADV